MVCLKLKKKKNNRLYGTVIATIIIELEPQNYIGIPKIEIPNLIFSQAYQLNVPCAGT